MQSSTGLVRLLVASDDVNVRRLIRQTLREVCRRIDVAASMLHLTDGSAITLKDDVNVPDEAKLAFRLVPKGPGCIRCAVEGATVVEEGFGRQLACPSGPTLEAAGFRSHACTPLTFGPTSIGALTALSRSPKSFTRANINLMIARGKRLVLALHHIAYFPELGSEWVDLEEMHVDLHAHRRSEREYHADLRPVDPTSVIGQVLAAANIDQPLTPSAVARSLQKGINWPTLRRICDHLEQSPGPVSRRSISNDLGFSDVTAGNYLSYLADVGIVIKEVVYGRVGRPTFLYRLSSQSSQDEYRAYTASMSQPATEGAGNR
ncbi:MAG: GAF domain-containing protein [Bacillota bacterium]